MLWMLLALTAPPPPTASVVRTCLLSVDGKVRVTGKCRVFPLGDRGYTLNVHGHGRPRYPHFAQVNADPGGRTGDAYWNQDPTDLHAQDPLGRVRLRGGCWVGRRVRMCAR